MDVKKDLTMKNIYFETKTNNVILSNISATAKSGEILAIIGQTGSGKTTFLNMIAGRQTPTKGSITLNGEVFDKRLRRRLAFVQQRDVFFSQLTLKETLEFTASLRISQDVPKNTKLQTIDNIVKSLCLEKCLNTVIGDEFTRGLSGGEKKRASIACELLSDPEFILLDEPTSGLDSGTALSVMEFLKQYTSQYNKLMILSIHQPSTKIYKMLNCLLILMDGKMVYNGQREYAIPFFTKLGAVSDQEDNPADLIIEYVSKCNDKIQDVIASKMRAEEHNELEEIGGTKSVIVQREMGEEKWLTSMWTQYKVLTSRNVKQSIRVLKQGYSVVQAVIVALLSSLFYFQIGMSLESSREVYGLIIHFVGYWTYLPALAAQARYGQERHVVAKERASGAYRLSAYVLSKMTSDLQDPFILSGIMYVILFCIGGFGGPGEFFITVTFMCIQAFACSGLGQLMAIVCRDARMAITSLLSYLIIVHLAGGFYTQNPPYWMEWLQYCSVFYYPYAFTISCLTASISDTPCNDFVAETFPTCIDNSTSFVTSSDILRQANVFWPPYVYAFVIMAYAASIRLACYITMRLRSDIIV